MDALLLPVADELCALLDHLGQGYVQDHSTCFAYRLLTQVPDQTDRTIALRALVVVMLYNELWNIVILAKEPQGLFNYYPGGIDGYVSYNGFYPDRDVDIVVLSNVESTDVFKIGLDLASLVFKGR